MARPAGVQGAEQCRFLLGLIQKIFDQMGGRGFAIGAGDAHHIHRLARLPIKDGRQFCAGFGDIVVTEHEGIGIIRLLCQCLGGNECGDRAFFEGAFAKLAAVDSGWDGPEVRLKQQWVRLAQRTSLLAACRFFLVWEELQNGDNRRCEVAIA